MKGIGGQGRSMLGAAVVITLCGTGYAAMAQQPGSPAVLIESSAVNRRVLKEINDPHSGARWLLLKDKDHPGGPGRLVASGAAGEEKDRKRPIVIRTGDRVVVEEHSAKADGYLDAVAMGTAAMGEAFAARLKMGAGVVVRAVVLGPGKAALAPRTEAR